MRAPAWVSALGLALAGWTVNAAPAAPTPAAPPASTATLVQPAPVANTLLDDWRWLVGPQRQVLWVTALGDAFLTERSSPAVYFLNTQSGRVSRVADSVAALEQRLADAAFVEDHLVPEAVADLRDHGRVLSPGQVYAMKTPEVLGGRLRLDNLEVADAAVHFSVMGQIHEQVRHLPDGTPLSQIKIRPR